MEQESRTRDEMPEELEPCLHCGIGAVLLRSTVTPYWHGNPDCPLDGWHGEAWEWAENVKGG